MAGIRVSDGRVFFNEFNKTVISSTCSNVVIEDEIDEKARTENYKMSKFIQSNAISKFINDSINYTTPISLSIDNNTFKKCKSVSIYVKQDMDTDFMSNSFCILVTKTIDKITALNNIRQSTSLFVRSISSVQYPNSHIVDMNIKCQIGLYFELVSDMFKGSKILETSKLPDGLTMRNDKIYGTPLAGGKFVSNIITDDNKKITIVFDISKLQRLI